MKDKMIAAAYTALEHAYAPYSHFRVGACVLTKDHHLYAGANVENASYGLCCCAERNALFAAISAGVQKEDIIALAVVSERDQAPSPCGACRQVMSELMEPQAEVHMVGKKECFSKRVDELLPFAFDKEDME